MAAPQMHSQMPNPEQPIKLEDAQSVGKPLSMEDFNTILHPKVGSPAASKPPKRTYTPHGKLAMPTKKSRLGSFEDMQGLAELKRKAIRECNLALKSNKPTNDPDSVIWNETCGLNRDIIIGPQAPLNFFKIIANLFDDLKNLTDDEKVANLLIRISRFVGENLRWIEVNY